MTTTNLTGTENSSQRDMDSVHINIEFSNRFRLEYIKHLISVSAGIFVISITFTKDIIGNLNKAIFEYILVLGWAFLLLAIISGVFHLGYVDQLFRSYRFPKTEGDKIRRPIIRWLKVFHRTQVLFFVLGVILIFIFASVNLVKH